MIAAAALLGLLLAPAPAAAAQAPPPCATFSRGSGSPPPLVRGWFADSDDERVLICAQGAGATSLYFGEGAVTRHGAVCSFVSHSLTTTGSGATHRLRRYDRTETVAMALANEECPLPHAADAAHGYVMTYDTSRAAFVAIMQLWRELTAASPTLEANPNLARLICCNLGSARSGAPGVPRAVADLKRLRAAIADGRVDATSVTRVVRLPGSVLRRRYALFVTDPGSVHPPGRVNESAGPPAEARHYVVYVQNTVRDRYQVSDIAETN